MSSAPSAPADGGQGQEGAAPPVSAQTEVQSPPAESGASQEPKPFYASLKNPEMRGWAENKGYKQTDPVEAFEALGRSYQNLEKLLGVPKEQILRLPADLSDKEAMKPIYERLNLAPPAEAKEYGFAAVEGIDPERAGLLEGIAHKHGVPKDMAAAVFADIIAAEREALAALEAQENEEAAIDRGKFMAKHGAKAEAMIENARRYVRQLGMSEELLGNMEAQMGVSAFWEFFAKAAEQIGEAGFVQGERKPTFDVTPEAAASERQMLMADKEFMTRWTSGDHMARQKMDRLNRIIAAGKDAKV